LGNKCTIIWPKKQYVHDVFFIMLLSKMAETGQNGCDLQHRIEVRGKSLRKKLCES